MKKTLVIFLTLGLLGIAVAQVRYSNSGGVAFDDDVTMTTLNIGRVLTPFNTLSLDGTNLVVNMASTNTFGIIELTGDCYIIASNLTSGARAQIEVRADGTARTITAVPEYKASGAESFSLTVTNHAVISLFNTGTATTNCFIDGKWFE